MPVNAVPQPETRMLIDLLRQVAIGATATYDDIALRVGFSVTDQPGRSRLAQARRIVMRDHQLVFGTIIRVGLKALEDTETVVHGSRSLASVRSYEAQPPVDKSRQQAVVAVASAVETLASRKSVDAIVRAPVSPIVDLKAMVAALARPA
jgi:hypothetical protein